jgi:hypothetical protein
MSLSQLNQIADAVAAELNGHAFSQPFVASSVLRPTVKLEDLEDLNVMVLGAARRCRPYSRAQSSYENDIDVGIRQRLGDGGEARLDALMALAEEIEAYMARRPLAAFAAGHWTGSALRNDWPYWPEHLDQLRQVTVVLRLTYRVIK